MCVVLLERSVSVVKSISFPAHDLLCKMSCTYVVILIYTRNLLHAPDVLPCHRSSTVCLHNTNPASLNITDIT